MFSADEESACRRLVALGLAEDLGTVGDVTSAGTIPAGQLGRAVLVSRAAGIVAGLPAAALVFGAVDPSVAFEEVRRDGDAIDAGDVLARVSGPMRAILAGERTALNFVQYLSGIATLTRRYVDAVAGLPARVLDTRKTLPGWRLLSKYAVRRGGGHNHRGGLHDGILIKDNHLAALGGRIPAAIRAARDAAPPGVPLEVEVDSLDQFDEALAVRPDIVLLDNMTPAQLREAVRRRDAAAPGVLLEASGGVNLSSVRAIAESGVDRISVGALTHSVAALDVGLDYETSFI